VDDHRSDWALAQLELVPDANAAPIGDDERSGASERAMLTFTGSSVQLHPVS
jgi:hypothetical protein